MNLCSYALTFLLFGMAARADVEIPPECKDAAAVVRNYMLLDSRGETTHPGKELDNLIDYGNVDKKQRFAFDASAIVSSSRLVDCKISGDNAFFHLSYLIKGELIARDGTFRAYHPEREEKIQLKVKKSLNIGKVK